MTQRLIFFAKIYLDVVSCWVSRLHQYSGIFFVSNNELILNFVLVISYRYAKKNLCISQEVSVVQAEIDFVSFFDLWLPSEKIFLVEYMLGYIFAAFSPLW